MRIAIVSGAQLPVPPTRYGGTEQVIYYLVKGLREAGHEPVLLGPADSKVDCEVIPIVGKALYFPRKPADLPEHQKRLAATVVKTRRELRKLLSRVDIVHSHGFDLSDYQHFPNLTTLHVRMIFEELPYYLERRHIPFVSISRNQRGACPDLNYVATVHNGEDPAEFPLVTKPEDYLCFVGRFDRDKQPHLAIQLAISRGIRIKLCGKLDYLGDGYFQTEVEPYFKHPLVEYLGEVSYERRVELVSKALCNLHPIGFREPFGLTVLEAAYCGTPTLAIARGSMPELIEHGRTGILAEDFVEGSFELERCLGLDRAYIARRARTRFNYSKMTAGYLKAYQRVLATGN
jgi:glycosyltransferase involved in cell wall biosynthesis